MRAIYLLLKRFFDFIFALIAIVIISPIMIPIMIALKLTAEGEVFYFQKRIGYKNEWFDIWKFATMLKNSPNMGTGSLTVRDDPRVTPVGKYLRITKINELPQIVNVLKGDMSFVGARPQMKVDFDVYPEKVKKVIFNTKPGITGIGSIVFRDEEKLMSETDMPIKEYYASVIAPYKGELELWYQKNISFYTDFMLLFLTAWVIMFPTSTLPFKVFKNLPKRPQALTLPKVVS